MRDEEQSPGDSHRVEETLVRLCRRVMRTERVAMDRTFADLGGDSLALVRFVAEVLREFDIGLGPDALLGAPTIESMKQVILERLAGPRGEAAPPAVCPEGPVPLIANRYSYFFRRRRDLGYWNVSAPILELRRPVDVDALRDAVAHLHRHHDGLRLQATGAGAGWGEVVVPCDAVAPLVIETYVGGEDADGPAFAAFTEAAMERVSNGFHFPGELFKVLLVQHAREEGAVLFVVAHHLLVDAYSFSLAVGDLVELYRQRRGGAPARLPPRTTSYREFAIRSTEHWLTRAEPETSWWRSLPWEQVRPPPVDHEPADGANEERHTRFAVESIPVGDAERFARRFGGRGQPTLAQLVLVAIARAYHEWSGHDILHLAMVFHGREPFADGIDLSRTVGWISETVPLLLPGSAPVEALGLETRRQLEHATSRGRSYGVLRHLATGAAAPGAFEAHPDPQISLNVIPPGIRRPDFSGVAERTDRFRRPQSARPTTERAFLLSGGVYFGDDSLHLSWDFSSRLYDQGTVERFTAACVRELRELVAKVPARDESQERG